MARLLPYEGDRPYVFVSYSHRNTDAAMQIIVRMVEAGYRVWYDEGIDPGTEWDENIAAHVEHCGYFLALISEDYLASDNCKDELNYARDLDKQRVLVYLENVELPGGMKMRLSRIQAIHMYTYPDEGAFYTKLFCTRGLQVCLGEAPPSQPAAEPLRPQPSHAQKSPTPRAGILERLRDAMREPSRPSGSNARPAAPAKAFATVSWPVDMSKEPELSAMLQALEAHPAFTVHNITHGAAVTRLEVAAESSMRMKTAAEELQRMTPGLPLRIDVAAHSPVLTVEVPRRQCFTIPLRDILESDELRQSSAPLPLALGRDIDGSPVICDLTRMPHLLIAGDPGSGAMMCLHAGICSLLYRCSPGEMRLLLVDSARAELSCYREIPHLLAPIIDAPHQAINALGWAADAMKERFQLLQDAGVRDLAGYNRKAPDSRKLPRLVIVISELADLRASYAKETEEYIVRLAQLGRAVGIHLIIATQQPSVNVLSGLIKANIPSRIAFKTESPVDSRTILDRSGAEKLIGCGDMLYMPIIANSPLRVQGCFFLNRDADEYTSQLRGLQHADYIAPLLAALAQEPAAQEEPAINLDLLIQAVEYAVEDRQVSISLLQRRLRIGYARAGRLMDQMDALHILGPKDGAKPRTCLITPEEFEAMKAEGVFHDVQ